MTALPSNPSWNRTAEHSARNRYGAVAMASPELRARSPESRAGRPRGRTRSALGGAAVETDIYGAAAWTRDDDGGTGGSGRRARRPTAKTDSPQGRPADRKSTRLNSSHANNSY